MTDDDLRYKEYKAQVPLKWSSFDQQGLPRSKRRFVEFLRSSSKRSAGMDDDTVWHDPDDAMDAPRAGNVTGRRGAAVDAGSPVAKKKRPWIEEMTAYCKEVEMRAIAKAKSQQLEAELRKRQERANLQRERALEAAATSLSAANGRQEGKVPSDVVCAAMELETQYLVQRHENRIAAKIAKSEDTLEKHLKVVRERQKAVEQSLHERSIQLHDDAERREAAAHKEALRQQEAKRRHLEEEIRKSEQHSKELEERLRQSREARNRQLAARREETERHIRHAHESREQRQRAYEEQLEEQLALTNQRLQERKREQEVLVAEDRVGKALARAQAERAEQRAKQLAACEQAEQHRIAALKEKSAADAELQLSIAQRNHDRERRASSNIARLTDQSLQRGQQVAARSHAATPSSVQRAQALSLTSAGEDESVVAKDLALHLERREQHVQELLDASHKWEADDFARHERWLQRQREEEALARAREQSREEKRKMTRLRALEAEQARAQSVEKESRQRQEKSEKVLQALRQEAHEGMHSANEEQARKARAAIELVQVKQRNELLRAMTEKERRIEAKAAERDALRRVQAQQHQEEQERRWSETMAHIQRVAEMREEHLQESLANKEERTRKAMLQREDAKHDLQKKLQAQDEARAASLRADEAARETRFLKSLERAAAEDAQWSAARDRQRRNENEYRAAVADEHYRRTEKAQQLRDKRHAEKMQHTIAVLKANYGRQTPHLSTHYDFHPPVVRPHSSHR